MAAELIHLSPAAVMKHQMQVTTITPAIARDWLENYYFSAQRPVNNNHVAYLVQTMRDGTFDGGETIRLVTWEEDGCFRLVNGQHRLRAIIQSGIPAEIVLVRTKVANFEEASRIYARIDRGRHRSISDLMRAIEDFPKYGMSAQIANKVSSAAAILESKFAVRAIVGASTYATRSADRRRDMAIQYAMPAMRFLEAIGSGDKPIQKLLAQRSIMALGIATYDNPLSLTCAENFWRGAAEDDGLARDDARKQMLRLLGAQTGSTRTRDRTALLWGVVDCWNAFFTDERLPYVRPDPDKPLEIQGTRFTGPWMRQPPSEL